MRASLGESSSAKYPLACVGTPPKARMIWRRINPGCLVVQASGSVIKIHERVRRVGEVIQSTEILAKCVWLHAPPLFEVAGSRPPVSDCTSVSTESLRNRYLGFCLFSPRPRPVIYHLRSPSASACAHEMPVKFPILPSRPVSRYTNFANSSRLGRVSDWEGEKRGRCGKIPGHTFPQTQLACRTGPR